MGSYISAQGNEILIDTGESAGAHYESDPRTELVSWIVGKVDRWETIRNQEHAAEWKEYWTKVRGIFKHSDKTRLSERSRIITPALSQAVEMTVSEIEEALFSRERWIDVAESVDPTYQAQAQPGQNEPTSGAPPPDLLHAVDLLLEDIELVNGKNAVAEGVQNAAIFGTGILKVCTDVWNIGTPKRGPTGKLENKEEPRVVVYWESIRADEFIPDPSGRNIKEMLGCAHRTRRPLHLVLEKIEQGVYLKSALADIGAPPPDSADMVDSEERAGFSQADVDTVLIDEWHGKVPAKFLLQMQSDKSSLDEALAQDLAERPMDGDGPLVEAIVTIANKSTLLRAMSNPFVMKDRSIIAWPHEQVPGQFWGRGVCEKGINAQRALDAEVRARIDALGFISAPMLGVDMNRMPKGFKQEIFPGKIWKTNGNPNEILTPIKVGQIDGTTFNQAQDMERMVQMATGALDTGSALGRAQTASGGNAVSTGSLFMGAFVKRSKRAIQSLCRNAIYPLIEKTLWRYAEFDGKRYPKLFKFVVKTALGIIAREVEQLNLTQVMAMLPQDAFPQIKVGIAKGIVELANLHNKSEIMAIMAQAMQPPTPEEQHQAAQQKAITLETALEELRNTKAQTTKLLAEVQEILTSAHVNSASAAVASTKTQIELRKVDLMGEENDQFGVQNDISRERLDLAQRALDHKIQMDTRAKPAAK